MIRKIKEKTFSRQSIRTVYGINRITADKIAGILGLHPLNKTSKRLYKSGFLFELLNLMLLETKLRVQIFNRIHVLIKLRSYRGIRHSMNLPSRGGRTHANGKTPLRLHKMNKALPIKLTKLNSIVLRKKNNKSKNFSSKNTKKIFNAKTTKKK